MAERIANIVLLVEDQNQERLLRGYLKRLGQGSRNVIVRKAPSGAGSGEQYVRGCYATEVRAIRNQMKRTRACLIVMIDADTNSTAQRRQTFKRALHDADLAERGQAEPIVELVPKRNVETWILCLNRNAVDEESDYKSEVSSGSIKPAAEALFEWTRPHASVPSVCVASLKESLPEFRRIPDQK